MAAEMYTSGRAKSSAAFWLYRTEASQRQRPPGRLRGIRLCLRAPNGVSTGHIGRQTSLHLPQAGWRLFARADLHVGPGRILERLELAGAGLAGRDLAAAFARQPGAPVGPPGAGVLGGAFEPRVRILGQLCIGPVGVFVSPGRIHDARNVPRRAKHELRWSRERLGAWIARAPRRDVILLGRD